MVCYTPLHGWRAKKPPIDEAGYITGSRGLVFNIREGDASDRMSVACGQCIGCRLEKSRQWALRCVHEAKLWEYNQFVTLTFDDEHLPRDFSVNVRVMQLFMKRLRKRLGKKIRFYACGEYGDRRGRPHYHLLLFNCYLPDLKLLKNTEAGPLFTSDVISSAWQQQGFCSVAAVTFETAAYVARYCMKKQMGEKKHSTVAFHPVRGCFVEQAPEFATMSNRPGIGADWFKRWSKEVYPRDTVVIAGREMRPPKYYDRLLEKDEPGLFDQVKVERIHRVQQAMLDNPDIGKRMLTKMQVKELQMKVFRRSLDGTH